MRIGFAKRWVALLLAVLLPLALGIVALADDAPLPAVPPPPEEVDSTPIAHEPDLPPAAVPEPKRTPAEPMQANAEVIPAQTNTPPTQHVAVALMLGAGVTAVVMLVGTLGGRRSRHQPKSG